MAPFTVSRRFSNNHLNQMAPAKADVSIPVDDNARPALLGDNFPQRELGLRKLSRVSKYISAKGD